MSSNAKNNRSATIVGEATGKISTTMVDAIKKLDGDKVEVMRMLRIAHSFIGAEIQHQNDVNESCDQD